MPEGGVLTGRRHEGDKRQYRSHPFLLRQSDFHGKPSWNRPSNVQTRRLLAWTTRTCVRPHSNASPSVKLSANLSSIIFTIAALGTPTRIRSLRVKKRSKQVAPPPPGEVPPESLQAQECLVNLGHGTVRICVDCEESHPKAVRLQQGDALRILRAACSSSLDQWELVDRPPATYLHADVRQGSLQARILCSLNHHG